MIKYYEDRYCIICGKKLGKSQIQRKQQHCSNKCSGLSIRKRIKVRCNFCGRRIEKTPYSTNRHKRNFCNRKCFDDWQRKEKVCFNPLIRDPDFQKKCRKALQKRPTNPEKRLIDIIKKYKLPFLYTGMGDKIVGNKNTGCKNPDFTHSNGKKMVIEMFGRVFHSPLHTINKKLRYVSTPKGTIEFYKRHRYKCIIIWDYDVDNEELVLSRINEAITKRR